MRKLVEMWLECSILESELINVGELERKVDEFNEKQLEIKIDNAIREGQYKFKLNKRFSASSYFRSMWGYYNEVVFLNNPSKLKVMNKIQYNDVEENGNISRKFIMNTKKEVILQILKNKL